MAGSLACRSAKVRFGSMTPLHSRRGFTPAKALSNPLAPGNGGLTGLAVQTLQS
jgi:hypothetical protein